MHGPHHSPFPIKVTWVTSHSCGRSGSNRLHCLWRLTWAATHGCLYNIKPQRRRAKEPEKQQVTHMRSSLKSAYLQLFQLEALCACKPCCVARVQHLEDRTERDTPSPAQHHVKQACKLHAPGSDHTPPGQRPDLVSVQPCCGGFCKVCLLVPLPEKQGQLLPPVRLMKAL